MRVQTQLLTSLREGPKRALLKLNLGGVVYPVGSVIPAEVWNGLSVQRRDRFLHAGQVEVAVDGASRQSTPTSFACEFPGCGMTFGTVQALGGHKSGHTKRAKRARRGRR